MNVEIAEQLWSLLPHPTPEHIVKLFGRNKEGKVVGDFARNTRELIRFTSGCNGTYNCYVCPNPTKRMDGIRHSAIDVTHWSFLLVDIDPIGSNPSPEEAYTEVMNRLSGLFGRNLYNNTPTVIDSGRGIQIWLRGEDMEFHPDAPYNRAHARKIMSFWLTNLLSKRLGMIYDCKVDTSTSDLPRPMRIPGTINIKTGREATFIHIQKEPFPWLFPTLIGGTPDEVLNEKEITITPGATWQKVFPRLTFTAQRYLIHGKEEPERHKTVFHVARSLAELGVAREETRKAIMRANTLQGKEQELSEKDIEHALDEAYKTLDNIAPV